MTKPKLKNSMFTDNEELHLNRQRSLQTVAPLKVPSTSQIVKPRLLMGDSLCIYIYSGNVEIMVSKIFVLVCPARRGSHCCVQMV